MENVEIQNIDIKTSNEVISNSQENVPGSFQIHTLKFARIFLLIDPLIPKVNLSVEECRAAGSKVIKVKEDWPPTSAAIALEVNIFKDPEEE